MKLHDIWKLFESEQFDQIVRSETERFESCWTELVNCDHVQKKKLIVALIAAGVDCDLRDAKGLTPVEQALAQNNAGELVEAMLLAEAELYSTQEMVYRLVRRGCLPVLEIFLELKRITDGDKHLLLSLALEEASVKVVRLTQVMSNYCHKFLLAFYYRSAGSCKWGDYERRQGILKLFDIILNEISFLQDYGSDSFTNIDNEYLQSLKIVSESLLNVNALWREDGVSGLGPYRLWNRLCSREIVFCFQIFIAIHMQQEGREECVLFIDKAFLSVLLEMLEFEIGAIKKNGSRPLIEAESMERDLEQLVLESDIFARWKCKFPKHKLNREQIRKIGKGKRVPAISERQQKYLKQLVSEKQNIRQIRSQWIKLHPKVRLSKKAIQWAIEKSRNSAIVRTKPFSERMAKKTRLALKMLHLRHDGARTLHSLKTLLVGIEAVKDIRLTGKIAREFAFAAFRRVLFVLGEYTKCTEDTPSLDNCSFTTAKILNTCSVLNVYKKQRNKISHGLSLADVNLRLRCDNGEMDGVLLAYCESIQEDLRKCYKSFHYIWVLSLLKAARSSLGRLTRLRLLEQCKSYCQLLSCVLKEQNQYVDKFNLYHNFPKMYSQLEEVMKIDELKHKYNDFKSIFNDIKQAENESRRNEDHHLRCLNLCLYHLRQLETADCRDSVKVKMIAMLRYTEVRFPDSILTLRKATNKLTSVMQEKRYSSGTAGALTLLNRHLTSKEDRSLDLSKVHFHQFLPFQNERYTEDLLVALDIHLNSRQFYSLHYEMTQEVYEPLTIDHIGNVFAVDKKFEVFERLLKKRHISYDVGLMELLRKEDGRKFQLLFEQMSQSLYDLSERAKRINDEYKFARDLAIRTGLLEICQALSHTNAFQANYQYFNTPMPLAVGTYLRNNLAHGSMLTGSIFFSSDDIIILTIHVLFEQRHQIMNRPSIERTPNVGDITRKYTRRKALLNELRMPFRLNPDKMTLLQNKRFDIYGRFYFLRPEARSGWHNFLDVVVYDYPDDTIRYIESVRNSVPCQQSVYYYLWNRLNYTGSIVGHPSLFSHRGESIMNAAKLEMNNILRYCMQMGKFEKFVDLFNRSGKQIKLMDVFSPSHPKCIQKLVKIIPWNAVDNENRTWLHLLCQVNNTEALQDALRIPAVSKLLNKKDGIGRTPLNIAANNGNFGIVDILLSNCDSLTLDVGTLHQVIMSHQNSLLKYFISDLENNRIEHASRFVAASIGLAGNVDALRYFKTKLSERAFRNLLAGKSILSNAFLTKSGRYVIERFLVFPEVLETLNQADDNGNKTPLVLDLNVGRFKCINLLVERGAVVNFPVIQTAAMQNSFRWTKRLYKMKARPLDDVELLVIIKGVLYYKINIRLLQFFTEQLTSLSVPYSYLFIAIQRRSLDHIRYLVSKFPGLLAQACDRSSYHPFISALYSIQDADSFLQDKPLIMYLLERCPNLLERDDLLIEAVKCCDLDTVQRLINKKVHLDGEKEGFTGLTMAAFLYTTRKENYGMLKLLLKRGASVRSLLNNKPDYLTHIHLMETILQETSFDPSEAFPRVSFITNACASGSLRLVKLLIETYNSDITLAPLTACISMDSHEVLRYVLSRCYSTPSNDIRLIMQALEYAIRIGKLKAVKLISTLDLNMEQISSSYAFTAHLLEQLHLFIYLHSIIKRN
ncbi:uncharacterized protein LOC129776321 [Toxorhynchites rutilus septentrionalis]|uniref:uncharacterized protein LOC129776321 n=1 Tax=Toxorhynchites rutilus septentrionalis TaxID=329112 RepID=UPI002479A64D|nr:uncharacterized protein LOC129776321 [Toxorhynchites rutilus septentrionalis]XP_055637872.1 uncharacterized protein LOC129776321 [Toxorhynchites rutilus septentrionalis]XP_055637873.1 uncharacterized protein LOC129776321 [Toxorhynchites rutilus septentrionalis]XP_055637874.1 uncharacterized protein LOC129776321 [Toxorhynchites rutilus septentrionalis]XP_055637875.1 uncharacterized protein LOC129776321 [Toxorhynchites rutilus septentrionalis]